MNPLTRKTLMALLLVIAFPGIAIACGSESAPEASQPTSTPGTTAGSGATPSPSPPDTSEGDSLVFEVTGDSEATFTVTEQLSRLPAPNDAVLRTSAITGEVRLDGDPFDLEIDLHALISDQSRRDDYVRNDLFPNQPSATINFDGIASVPAGLQGGDEITTSATGTVNVNGADAEITFEIESRLDGDTLFVLGRADFVWADFGMTAPVSQFFVVEDEVRVEVLLATERM